MSNYWSVSVGSSLSSAEGGGVRAYLHGGMMQNDVGQMYTTMIAVGQKYEMSTVFARKFLAFTAQCQICMADIFRYT
jgi:hypothetical protein